MNGGTNPGKVAWKGGVNVLPGNVRMNPVLGSPAWPLPKNPGTVSPLVVMPIRLVNVVPMKGGWAVSLIVSQLWPAACAPIGASAAPHAASPAAAIPPALERANANIVEIVTFMIASRMG